MRAGRGRHARLPPRRPPVRALRRPDPLLSAGRRGPDRVLVPGVPGRNGPRGGVTVPRVRPGFRRADLRPGVRARLRARRTCTPRSAASASARSSTSGMELEGGADLPIALEEHAGPNRPTLYEYRPLVGSFIEQRARAARPARGRARGARRAQGRARRRDLRERARRPARRRGRGAPAHDPRSRCSSAPRRRAAASTGTTTPSTASYAQLERSLYGDRRSYAALAPLVGLTAGGTTDLGRGVRVRPAAANELTAAWPDAGRLLPARLGPGNRPHARPRARGRARLAGLPRARTPPASSAGP